jgi:hypothetical protein
MEIKRVKSTEDPTKGMTPEALKQIMEDLKTKAHGKPVKPPFRHVIQTDWHRTFSWKERLQILLGYSLEVAVRIPTLHRPGELGVLMMAQTTPFEQPADKLRERAKEAVIKQYGVTLDMLENTP